MFFTLPNSCDFHDLSIVSALSFSPYPYLLHTHTVGSPHLSLSLTHSPCTMQLDGLPPLAFGSLLEKVLAFWSSMDLRRGNEEVFETPTLLHTASSRNSIQFTFKFEFISFHSFISFDGREGGSWRRNSRPIAFFNLMPLLDYENARVKRYLMNNNNSDNKSTDNKNAPKTTTDLCANAALIAGTIAEVVVVCGRWQWKYFSTCLSLSPHAITHSSTTSTEFIN